MCLSGKKVWPSSFFGARVRFDDTYLTVKSDLLVAHHDWSSWFVQFLDRNFAVFSPNVQNSLDHRSIIESSDKYY